MIKLLQRSRVESWKPLVKRIERLGLELQSLGDDGLRKQSLRLGFEARSGETSAHLLPDAYALVFESARRHLGLKLYPVQLLAGIALNSGCVAEMQTGEGKTLTATLPLYLASLYGRGAHLATANDYLAARDADLMRPVFHALGQSVGVVCADTPRHKRAEAYRCDITYGTAKEFGFDFLRDRLNTRWQFDQGASLGSKLFEYDRQPGTIDLVQRGFHFGLIDEADSIMIDEARTPLVVSALPGQFDIDRSALYRWAADTVTRFEEDAHYDWDTARRQLSLNADGRRLVRSLASQDQTANAGLLEVYQLVETALLVSIRYRRDKHYVVRDDEIVIVDEHTGRLAEGRQWRGGIHQAIEAKEGLQISQSSGHAARITVQDLMLKYSKLAGMTGTALSSRREFEKIYALQVVRVPTHRPSQRKALPDRVFGSESAKWDALVEEICEVHRSRRPILVGTRTIEQSEWLAEQLRGRGIEPQVLHARNLAEEAAIVARAGHAGKVTVATNMAGRGTDIQLGESVAELGGMHVICTELHECRRIDRQLIGRCGRQGDPGSHRCFMSFDDEVVTVGLGSVRARRKRNLQNDGELPAAAGATIRAAQRSIERRYYQERRMLLLRERERQKLHQQLGQDPYLDSPE